MPRTLPAGLDGEIGSRGCLPTVLRGGPGLARSDSGRHAGGQDAVDDVDVALVPDQCLANLDLRNVVITGQQCEQDRPGRALCPKGCGQGCFPLLPYCLGDSLEGGDTCGGLRPVFGGQGSPVGRLPAAVSHDQGDQAVTAGLGHRGHDWLPLESR